MFLASSWEQKGTKMGFFDLDEDVRDPFDEMFDYNGDGKLDAFEKAIQLQFLQGEDVEPDEEEDEDFDLFDDLEEDSEEDDEEDKEDDED